MDSKKAILLSTLGKKKVPSAQEIHSPAVVEERVVPTTEEVPSSLELLKSQKVSPAGVPSSNRMGELLMKETSITPSTETEIRTKKVPYSPVLEYLKRGK